MTGELLRESAVLARKLGVRLHTHLAETRDEEQFTLSHFDAASGVHGKPGMDRAGRVVRPRNPF